MKTKNSLTPELNTPKTSLKDKIPVRGHFNVQMLDKRGNIIDEFDSKNLIVNLTRLYFLKLLSGQYDQIKFIDGIYLGTQGCNPLKGANGANLTDEAGNIVLNDSSPKTEADGLVASLTDIFSNPLQDTTLAKRGHTYDFIKFTPAKITVVGNVGNANATGVTDGANNASTVNIAVDYNTAEPFVRYTFEIATDAFNGVANYIKYNEAGLYSGNDLIAIRTFNSKAKDNATAMRITWTLIF